MTTAIPNPTDDRIIATYKSSDTANQAKVVLTRKLGIQSDDIEIISPTDDNLGKKLEGESKPIGKSMLTKHIKYPAIGLFIGMCIAFLLVQFGPAFAQISPMFTFIALISPGIFIGAFYAGFRSLKPEHDPINQHALSASDDNNWTLLVNTPQGDISKKDIADELQRTQCIAVKGAD